MPLGTVKYVDRDGRFGFISRDDKLPKVFLHRSEVEKVGLDEIVKGQRWLFDVVEGRDGRPAAGNLRFEPAEGLVDYYEESTLINTER